MALHLPTRLASRVPLPPDNPDFSTAFSSAFATDIGGYDSGFDSGFDAGTRPEDTAPFNWLIRPDTQPLPISTGAGFVWGDSVFPLPVPAAPSATIELAGTIAGQATVTANLENIAGNIRELAGNIDGSTTVTGTLKVTIELVGTITGQTTVTGRLDKTFIPDPISSTTTVAGTLTNLSAFGGLPAGSTTVSARLDPILYGFGGIPLQIGFGGLHAANLTPLPSSGSTSVTGYLAITTKLAGAIAGVGAVTGTLTNTLPVFAGAISGSTTVTGYLTVTVDAGGGKEAHELSGSIAGSTSVVNTWYLTHNLPGADPSDGYVKQRSASWWYQYAEVSVAYDDIDDASGHPDFVSQTYPDGNLIADDYPVLYQYINVGVGYGPIDSIATRPDFVSETFPDGDLTTIDYPAFYQLLNVIPAIDGGHNQLVILPGWTPKIPPPKNPPKGVNQ